MKPVLLVVHLWLSISLAIGIQISGTIDKVPYISHSFLLTMMPEIISRPTNLYDLLRINETHNYGISTIIGKSCPGWTILEWGMVQEYVEGRPKLASVLIPPNCLELFEMSAKMNAQNPIFNARYAFALKLSPLPLSLSTRADIKLLLDNINLVREYELELWFSKSDFAKTIDAFANCKEQILELGMTHHFLYPSNAMALSNVESRRNYSSMLETIRQSTELFGHAAHLKSLLAEINLYQRRGLHCTWMGNVENFIQKVFNDLQIRLLTATSLSSNEKSQSAEKISYRLYLKSKDQIIKDKKSINAHLQNCDSFNFQQLATAIAWKLDYECKEFLSKENRAKLLDHPSTKSIVLEVCLGREERIAHFHRWLRVLPHSIPRRFANLSELWKYFLDNFYALPPNLNGMSLENFLDYLQLEIVKDSQLEIHKEDFIVLTVRKDLDVKLAYMTEKTFVYVCSSLVKQLYFQSSERFDQRLLDWIEIISVSKIAPGAVRKLKSIVSSIYLNISKD